MSQVQKRPSSSRWSEPSPKRLEIEQGAGSCCDLSVLESEKETNETCSSRDESTVVIGEFASIDDIEERIDILNWTLHAVEYELQIEDDALKITKLEEMSQELSAKEEEAKSAREGLEEERAKTAAQQQLFEDRVKELEYKLRKYRTRAGTKELLATAHLTDLKSRLRVSEERAEELKSSLDLTRFALDSVIRGGNQKVEEVKKDSEKMKHFFEEKEATFKEMYLQREKAIKLASASLEARESTDNRLEEVTREADGYKIELEHKKQEVTELQEALNQSKQHNLDIEKQIEELSKRVASSENEDLEESEPRGAHPILEVLVQMSAESRSNELNEKLRGEFNQELELSKDIASSENGDSERNNTGEAVAIEVQLPAESLIIEQGEKLLQESEHHELEEGELEEGELED